MKTNDYVWAESWLVSRIARQIKTNLISNKYTNVHAHICPCIRGSGSEHI